MRSPDQHDQEMTYTECIQDPIWVKMFTYTVCVGIVFVLVMYVLYLLEIASCAVIYRYQCLELAPK
jgi:hypothetical protein